MKSNTQPKKIQDQVQWDNGTTLMVGDWMLAGIEKKCISKNRSVKVRIFPCATTRNMYDYLKPLLKKNPDSITCMVEPIICWMKHLVISWMKYYPCKTLLKNAVQHAKL